jgi:predicted transcriptional regulator
MAIGEKPTTVLVDHRTLKRVDGFARAKSRSRAWVVKQTVEHLIEYEKWFAREVKAGLRDVERGHLLEHDAVVRKWERRREASLDARRRP